MKVRTKQEMIEIAKVIFINGDTYMSVVWLMFLLGIIFGLLMRRC
jgi:hypothetical protein